MKLKKWSTLFVAGAMLLSLGIGTFNRTELQAEDAQFAGEFWYDQIDTVELNRELAHSHFVPYADLNTALSNEESVFTKNPTNSSNVMSLNGEWDFHFSVNPAARLSDPDLEELPNGKWQGLTDRIKVPSSVEAQRNSDGTFKYAQPIYVNQSYPWGNFEAVDYSAAAGTSAKAPTVKNGVSHFQRTFTLDPSWQADGRQVYVNFEGVESAFYLYINGHRVGYAEDSYTNDEFNITKYLNPAGSENTISVQVYRWSTGSYLENQDFIRLSGIFRDVNLYNRPALSVRDFFFKPSVVDANGKVDLELFLRNNRDSSQMANVEVQIYPQHGNTALLSAPLTLTAEVAPSTGIKDAGTKLEGTTTLANPALWTADQPNLYRAVITLKDATNNVQEIICQRIGFRNLQSVVINSNNQHQLQINGKKIYFRGTNRHESDLMNGRALGHEAIKQDLLLMKKNNINGIRTSHYPNDPITYDLADELGIYLCDETNVESHRGATSESQIPSAHKIWNTSVMDRTMNMVERDKNHPAVVIWSLGNEATYRTYPMNDNYCFWNSTQWILQRDPSRIRKYERDNRSSVDADGNILRDRSMVDIYSSQYWSVSYVESHVTNSNNKLPYIQSEYAHSMGNALGNFKEYWDVFRKYDNAQGGFVWDWIDQSLLTTIKNNYSYKLREGDGAIGITGKFVEGRSGKAIEGHYILENTSKYTARADQGMTLDAYFKLPQGTPLQGDLPILSKGDSGYNLKLKGSKLELFFNGWSKGVLNYKAPDSLNDGNWHRLTGTVNAQGVFTLYYDGAKLASSGTIAVAPFDTNSIGVGVGIDSEFQQRTWPGTIDSVRIMTRAMSDEEVAAGMVAADAEGVLYACDFSDSDIIREGSEDAVQFWGYGGDWDDKRLNDGNFVGNGILTADRKPTGKLAEIKKVLQEVNFYPTANVLNGEIKVVNEFPATDLSNYEIRWELLKNDKVIANGDCSTSLEPQTSKLINLALPQLTDVRAGDDYFLNFHVLTKTETAWAPVGYEIATEQMLLPVESKLPRPAIDFSGSFASVNEDDANVTVTGTNFSLVLDKQSGYITQYTYEGKTLLDKGPVPSYFRAPVDNDPKNHEDAVKNADVKLSERNVNVTRTDKYVQLVMQAKLPTNQTSQVTLKYTILPSGEVIVSHAATLNTRDILRVGMRLAVPDEYNQVNFYGRGPLENYVDRKTGSLVAVYSTDVPSLEAENKYLRPQENGSRSDVRYVALRNAEGQGLLISSEEPFAMSASHYKAEDLSRARHLYQVPRQSDIMLTIDAAQRGLGNASCGPGPLAEYLLPAGKYAQTFRIQPLAAAKTADEIMEMSKASTRTLNAVRDILVNGNSVQFNPEQATYNVKIVKNTYSGSAPKVEVLPTSDAVTLEYQQPTSLPATVNVHAVSPLGFTEDYVVNIEEVESLYLSEMPWTENKSGYFTNSRDLCGNNKISLYVENQKQEYAKGVGAHAPSAIAVDISNMKLTKFTSRVGINSNQAPGAPSDVIFRVYVDGKVAYEQRVLAGQSFPCDVDVTNAKTVRFEVDANGPDYNDHASWADAKFIREESEQPTETSVEETSTEATTEVTTETTAAEAETTATTVAPTQPTGVPSTAQRTFVATAVEDKVKVQLEIKDSSILPLLPDDLQVQVNLVKAANVAGSKTEYEKIYDVKLLHNGREFKLNDVDMQLTIAKNSLENLAQGQIVKASVKGISLPGLTSSTVENCPLSINAAGDYVLNIRHLSLYGLRGKLQTTSVITPNEQPAVEKPVYNSFEFSNDKTTHRFAVMKTGEAAGAQVLLAVTSLLAAAYCLSRKRK